MTSKNRSARTSSILGTLLLVSLLGSAAQAGPSVAESPGQLVSRVTTGPLFGPQFRSEDTKARYAVARRLKAPAPLAPLAPPAPESFPSSTAMAYDMFGAPYRSDGMTHGGVKVGAPPWGKHELVPQRLNTSFDYYEGARQGQFPPWDGKYYSPWGQIFIGQGNTAANVRLQVRNTHTLYLDSDNVWRNLRGDVSNWKMEGSYLDTYFFGVGLGNSVRDESANGGGWSVSLAPLVNTPAAASWHWWLNGYYPRTPIPVGTKALFQAQQMRLITDGAGDDPAADTTRFIASFGADAYTSATTGTPPITPWMQPRMKRIRSEWVWVTGHSFKAWWTTGFGPSNILENPPTEWPA